MAELPFGSEFSPNQIDLPELLEYCKNNEENKAALEEQIKNRYFVSHDSTSESNRCKLAMNCRLGLRAYGIIDENCKLTDLGNQLYSLKNDEKALYDSFARHILLNLNGMGFVQCIKDMTSAMEKITLESMRPQLETRGITFPVGGKHPSIMRLWLSKAGFFSEKGYDIDNDRLSEILGNNDDISVLRMFTKEQRYFLLALLNMGTEDFQPASSVARLASATYGLSYSEKNLPKTVLKDIEESGYIEINKATVGRGAKSHLCKLTDKARKDLLEPLIKHLESQTDPKLIKMLTKGMSEIIKDIKSKNTYTKGIALEALAFKLLRILGLEYVATRVRAEATGGNEVDLLFQSKRPVYSRWQIQCKNTDSVSIDYVAREVGLSQILYSNVIVMITTGVVSPKARKYANHIMKNSNLNIVFIDKDDISEISKNPIAIIDIFDREAAKTMQLKKIDLSSI